MTNQSRDQFDLRRMEALSNTIFGVAMTLLAYDIPKLLQNVDPSDLGSIARALTLRVIVITLSFAVAGVFWFSHLRRIAHRPDGDGFVVALNLFFLLTIILLPASTTLIASGTDSPISARIYSAHMLVASAINALLWIAATRGADRLMASAALYGCVIFAGALAASFWSLGLTQGLLIGALASPFVHISVAALRKRRDLDRDAKN